MQENYDLFEYMLGKLNTNAWYLIRESSYFGRYNVSDEDLRAMFDNFFQEYVAKHLEINIDKVRKKLRPLFEGQLNVPEK